MDKGEPRSLTIAEYKAIISLLDDLTIEEELKLMDQVIDLTKGGIAVVLHGNTGFVKEYANHPSVKFLNTHEIKGEQLEENVPANTRVVIITDGLPQYHYTWITAFARRKNIPFLVRKSNQAVYESLKKCFPNNEEDKKANPEEVKDAFTKGKLNPLIQFIDWGKSNAENGRLLAKKALEMDIASTVGSLTQFVAIQRKKQGRGDLPKSVRSQLDISVEFLDNAIRDLGSIRDYLINTTEENRILKQKLEKFKKAMED